MSDYYLILIPEEAGYIPPEAARANVLEKFREIAKSEEEVSVELTDQVRFEHCGGNFGKISCPDCGKEIGFDWWKEKMDEDFGESKSFRLALVELPCCGTRRTLHDLRYESPQGFAKFSLSAFNPNVGKLSQDSLHHLEAAARCKLRAIYKRF